MARCGEMRMGETRTMAGTARWGEESAADGGNYHNNKQDKKKTSAAAAAKRAGDTPRRDAFLPMPALR
jgi:hypothetical protein